MRELLLRFTCGVSYQMCTRLAASIELVLSLYLYLVLFFRSARRTFFPMPTHPQQLEQVRDLIKAKKRGEAVKRLTALIENDHDNPELWWLMANALDDPQAIRRALDEMIVVAPNPTAYQERARKLQARLLVTEIAGDKAGGGLSGIGWALLILLLTAIVIGVALFLSDLENRRVQELAAQTALPTLVQLPTQTATESATATLTMTPSATATATASPTVTPSATDTPSSTPTPDLTLTAAFFVPEQTLESTAEALPTSLTPPAPQTTPEQAPPDVNPLATTSASGGQTAQVAQSSALEVQAAVRVSRDILVDDSERRSVILPHEEHVWTFSGYRDEQVTLSAAALGANAAVTLELYDSNGVLVMQGSDSLSVALPADGVYLLTVRVGAIDQQLYTLRLERES